MSEIKLTIDGTVYDLEKSINSNFYKDKTPRMFFDGELYVGSAIPKEQVNKDYEIIQFNDKDGSTLMIGKNQYNCWYIYDKVGKQNFNRNEKWMIDNSYPISSVKRLSDGDVFSIDDDTDKGKIFAFEIRDNRMCVHGNMEGCTSFFHLTDIEKVKTKQKLFTTEDGVDIFSWDHVWLLSTTSWILHETIVPANADPFKGSTGKEFKYFSTREAGGQYIFENKPVLVTYKELDDYLTGRDSWYKEIKNFFKAKIKT